MTNTEAVIEFYNEHPFCDLLYFLNDLPKDYVLLGITKENTNSECLCLLLLSYVLVD